MTSCAAHSTAGAPGRWRREMSQVVLRPDGPGTLGDLARVLARASGADGAVLWEIPPTPDPPTPDSPTPDSAAPASVLARWIAGPAQREPYGHAAPDPVTDRACRVRSLALPCDLPGAPPPTLFGLPVAAALPVDYPHGAAGVLSLLGAGELSDHAFDVAAELVEMLPELCGILRERQTLALVHACNTVLHDADVESPDHPLHAERLREHLEQVCRLVAHTLECAEVTIFLQTTRCADYRYPLFASSGTSAPGDQADSGPEPVTPTARAAGTCPRPRVDGPLMELPLRSGNHVWGLLRCTRAPGLPLHFTTSDLPVLRPVATAVAQYWRTWLHRRTISAENNSWRQLAAGISGFNRLLAKELRGNADWDPRREKRVYDAALRIVQDVVPESTRVVASRADPDGEAAARLVLLSSVGDDRPEFPAAHGTLVERVFRTHCQLWVNDADELARDGAGPNTGWLLGTPIGVGNQVYGVLQASGPDTELPANSAQVCEIIADQLGLYRHLQQARQVLQRSARTQAETMEDLKHQLASPLRTATDRADLVIRSGRFDSRAETQLKAVRGLCRKASRVAMSAGVFAALSRGQRPAPRTELLGADELLRLLIAGADDAQVLSNPVLGIRFEVDRDSVRGLGRRLVDVDPSFLHQCVGNVLDNAGKYGYPDTRVRIGAAVADDQVAIEITSTGIRLDPDEVACCLKRNWRGELARSTTGEGSGIGLWIADHLMRAMNGTVQLHPAADTTTARLVLPLT